MNSEQKFYEDFEDKKNITPFGVDKPLHKWFEEINEVDTEYKENIKSSAGIDLVLGKWKDPKCLKVAVVCEYKKHFLEFCKANEGDNKRLFFHVWDKESTAGYEFDSYIILDQYLSRFVDIVDQVRSRIR